MKSTLLLTIICTFLFIRSFAQNNNKNRMIEYELEYEYNPSKSSGLDSTFIIYCVFDKNEIENIDSIQVIRTKKNEVKSFSICLQTTEVAISMNKKIYVNIGNTNQGLTTNAVYFKGKNGTHIKGNLKVKGQKLN